MMESTSSGTISSFLRKALPHFEKQYPILLDLMSIQENLLQIC